MKCVIRLAAGAGKFENIIRRPDILSIRYTSGKVVPAILHTITREEIEQKNLCRLVADCRPNTKRDVLRKSANRIVWAVNGYGEVDEELYLIPEVRQFFLEATCRWPHWLFTSALGFPSLLVVAFSTFHDLTVVRRGKRVLVSFDAARMEMFFSGCLPITNVLDALAGVSPEARQLELVKFRRQMGLD